MLQHSCAQRQPDDRHVVIISGMAKQKVPDPMDRHGSFGVPLLLAPFFCDLNPNVRQGFLKHAARF